VKLRLETLLRVPTDSTAVQFLRYVFVGGAAFVLDFGTLFVLTEYARVYYLTSAAIAFLLGLVANYALSVFWVFNRRTLERRWLEFGVFALVGVVGLGFNELFIWFFTEHAHLYYMVSKVIATALVLLWNFFARKYLLFR
jgi:putative flippase GtrA